MSAVIPLTRTAAALLAKRDTMPKLWQAERISERAELLRPLIAAIRAGVPKSAALQQWSKLTGQSGATGRRWLNAWERGGEAALVPGYGKRVPNLEGLEALILRLFNDPSRPNCGTIALRIEEETGKQIPAHRIRRFIRNLPAIAAQESPARMGRHTYDMRVRPYIERDATVFGFGEAMVADGHCMKVWCLHPVTNKPFRAEFTPILDIRSNYLFGFWLSEAESADTTIFALSTVIAEHKHAPTIFYTDPGPGFRNKRVAIFFQRLGVTHVTTRAGNARGKGFGEGFFRLFIERFAKRYETCCSRDRTDDLLARMETKLKRGEIHAPRFDELHADLRRCMELYNQRPQPYSKRLLGRAPIDLMEGWQRNVVDVPVGELLRPARTVTVRGSAVKTLRRRYVHSDLLAYEKRQVVVEFDLCDLGRIFVRDLEGRFVCEAALAEAVPYFPKTFLEEARQKSDAAKIKRLRRKEEEIDARSRPAIAPAAFLEPEDEPQTAPEIDILKQGHHITVPDRQTRAPRVKPVSARAIALAEALDVREEQESAEARFARALALEAMADISDADARWLSIYRTSAEYAARRLIHEDQQEEGAGGETPAPDGNNRSKETPL